MILFIIWIYLLIPKYKILDNGVIKELKSHLYLIRKYNHFKVSNEKNIKSGLIIRIVGIEIYNNVLVTKNDNSTNKEILEELENINNKINEFFILSKTDNIEIEISSYWIDKENEVVVVRLIENTKKMQKWFRENIIDSKLIKFEQGVPVYY